MIGTQRTGVALVLCAPSGTGKTTLARRLVQEFPRFSFSISCTTRGPRPGEVNGKDYHFVSVDEFHAYRQQGFFAEWAEVHGNYYGTPLQSACEMLGQGRDLLFDIDVQGAAQLKQTLPQATFIFLLPPSRQELLTRLRKRGTETEETLARRLANARLELAQANWFDYWIINREIEEAYTDLRTAYLASGLVPRRRQSFVNALLQEWT